MSLLLLFQGTDSTPVTPPDTHDPGWPIRESDYRDYYRRRRAPPRERARKERPPLPEKRSGIVPTENAPVLPPQYIARLLMPADAGPDPAALLDRMVQAITALQSRNEMARVAARAEEAQIARARFEVLAEMRRQEAERQRAAHAAAETQETQEMIELINIIESDLDRPPTTPEKSE